jgi:hypothetical protein
VSTEEPTQPPSQNLLTIEDYFLAITTAFLVPTITAQKRALLAQEMDDPNSYLSIITRAIAARAHARQEHRLGFSSRSALQPPESHTPARLAPYYHHAIVTAIRELHAQGRISEEHANEVLAHGRQELCWIDSESDQQITQDIFIPVPVGRAPADRRAALCRVTPGLTEVLHEMVTRMSHAIEQLAPELVPEIQQRMTRVRESREHPRR